MLIELNIPICADAKFATLSLTLNGTKNNNNSWQIVAYTTIYRRSRFF